MTNRYKNLFSEFSRFTAVGVAGTAAHYGVMALLIEFYSIAPWLASAAGFISSAALSYALNHRFTFSTSVSHVSAFPRFLAIGTVGLCINLIIVATLTEIVALHWLIAQAVASIIVLCWNFFANRSWTFRSD